MKENTENSKHSHNLTTILQQLATSSWQLSNHQRSTLLQQLNKV